MLGMLRGLLAVGLHTSVAIQLDSLSNLVTLTVLGTELVALLLAIAGMVGVGLLFARRGRAGVYLMLTAGAEIVVMLLAQGVLMNLAVPAPVRTPYTLPSTPFLMFALSPGVLLLVAGILALAPMRTGARV